MSEIPHDEKAEICPCEGCGYERFSRWADKVDAETGQGNLTGCLVDLVVGIVIVGIILVAVRWIGG
jgi:hypothetical protein